MRTPCSAEARCATISGFARAAAGNNQVGDARAPRRPTVNRVHDGKRRQYRRRADQIGVLCAARGGMRNEAPDVLFAELLAPGGFGRRRAKVFRSQKRIEQFRQQLAAHGNLRIAIELLLPVSRAANERVNHHVARPGVERHDIAQRRTGRNDRDVCDSLRC